MIDRAVVKSAEKWLGAIPAGRPAAIVLGASSNGLSFARSLGRRKIPVLMLDSSPLLGTFTRYATSILLPPVNEQPESWLEFFEFIGARLASFGILFSTSDELSLLVARNEKALERHFRFILPPVQSLERIIDKREQYTAARASGIPIPTVYFPESIEQAARIAADITYPCLLKPYESQSARPKICGKLVCVHHPDQLVAEFERISAMDVPLMIQEYIDGDDSALVGYLAFWDREGHERAWMTKAKLRQYPPKFGDGSLQVAVDLPEVAELSRKFIREFEYRGFVSVEFKRDARDGSYRLMEINARTVSGNQLAVSSGVDFPWIGYQYLNGADIGSQPIRPDQNDTLWMHEGLDFKTFMVLRKSGKLTLWKWLDSFLRAQSRAVGAVDDPLPLLVGIKKLFF